MQLGIVISHYHNISKCSISITTKIFRFTEFLLGIFDNFIMKYFGCGFVGCVITFFSTKRLRHYHIL